jgi:hypothetical protein
MQVGRFRYRLHDFKAPAVLQRRNACSRFGHFRGIDPGHDYPGFGAAFRNDAPPRVNDQ